MAKLIAEKSTSRLNLQNEQDLNPVLVDRKFGRPEDFMEIFIMDLNNNILDHIPNFIDYKVLNDLFISVIFFMKFKY